MVTPAFLWADNTPESGDWPGWWGQNNDAIVTGTGLLQGGGGYEFEERWLRPLGSGYSSVSIAEGIAVTMFSDNGDDYAIALDALTGEEQWCYRIDITHLGRFGSAGGPISTPLIADGNVYGLGPRGQLFALDVQTVNRCGRTTW